MSSKPEPAQNSELLQESEYKSLFSLCYNKEDIAAMTPELARQKIERKIPKPGSKKAIAKNLKETGQTAAGVEELYNDEAIEERNADKEKIEVLVSDWYNKNSASCAKGKGTIFDVVARPVQARFPELDFRWLDPAMNEKLGTDNFERFYDPATGKDYQVGNQYLAFRPRVVAEQRQREQAEMNAAQFRNVTSELRHQNQELEDQNYGGSYQDNVRMQREGQRAVRL